MMALMPNRSIGERIRLRRHVLGLTQQALADAVGVNRSTVSAWETGKQQPERHEGMIEAVLRFSLTSNGTGDGPDPAVAFLRNAPPALGFTEEQIARMIKVRNDLRDRPPEPPAEGRRARAD
jgi:hypothetical protein